MKQETKQRYVSIRCCANGWEVSPCRMQDMTTMSDVYVFETWESMVRWLDANLENNTTSHS